MNYSGDQILASYDQLESQAISTVKEYATHALMWLEEHFHDEETRGTYLAPELQMQFITAYIRRVLRISIQERSLRD